MKTILYLSTTFLLFVSCIKKENTLLKPFSNEQEQSETMLSIEDNDTLKIDLNSALHTITFNKKERASYVLKINSDFQTEAAFKLKTEDSLSNIRFSQITTPSMVSDGPFGNVLNYRFKEKGTYYIRINENMMAGDPWAGKVVLSISRK